MDNKDIKENICQNNESSDSTDGRRVCEWQSRYPVEAKKEMFWESVLVLCLFFFALFLIFATWRGWLAELCVIPAKDLIAFNKYAYYSFSGFLGGLVFGMKYLYRVIARGYWHQDRKAWRIMSPFIALSVAFIVGNLIDASIINANKPLITPAIVSIGFLSGYFADEAVGKMYEIASVIFGKSTIMKKGES